MVKRSETDRKLGTTAVLCIVAALVALPQGQGRNAPRITPPNEQFGKSIGDDYFLVNWTQWVEYLQKMDRESDRMTVVEIGKTAEGRSQYTAIVTSPENHEQLAQFKEMNRRLALADGVTDDEARQLARDGRVVVWIDGGLHATEVLGAAQLIELTYRLNSATDSETMRILDDAIVLLTNINPDGMELVSNWYMREPDERRRSIGGVPRLYQKYIGHDNNRDFYMMNQPESENANRVMYREWYPAIMSQPPSDRSRGRGAIRAAVPRSVQLPLRSADPARHRPRRGGDPHAAGRGREARRGDAIGGELFDVVQRRDPHDVVLP